MKIRNPIVKFLLTFFIVFGIMIIPWPGLEEAFVNFFRAEGQWASGILGSKVIVQFYSGNEQFDTQINLACREMIRPDGTVKSVFLRLSSRSTAYLPICMFISLILATPFKWKRKIWAFFWGFLLTNGFICLKIILLIIHRFNHTESCNLFELNPAWKEKLNYLVYFLVESGETSLLVAVVIWLLVSFRKNEWKLFLSNAPEQ